MISTYVKFFTNILDIKISDFNVWGARRVIARSGIARVGGKIPIETPKIVIFNV